MYPGVLPRGPKGERAQVEITIVGKEDVNGKIGYWLETANSSPNGSEVYFKDLMITVNEGLAYAKRIKQVSGQDAIEFDMNANSGERMTTPSDIREEAELIGSETISVPAGTFACQHYRLRSGSGDVWVSDKVSPWGLVKMLFKNENQPLEFRTDGREIPNSPNLARGKDSSIRID